MAGSGLRSLGVVSEGKASYIEDRSRAWVRFLLVSHNRRKASPLYMSHLAKGGPGLHIIPPLSQVSHAALIIEYRLCGL